MNEWIEQKQEYGLHNILLISLVSPVLGHVSPEEQVVEGQSLRLSCVVVLGTPKPTLMWLKDNRPVANGHNVQVTGTRGFLHHNYSTFVSTLSTPLKTFQIQGEGSGLMIHRMETSDEGRYTCVATNAAGNATINVNVNVISKKVSLLTVIKILVKNFRATVKFL